MTPEVQTQLGNNNTTVNLDVHEASHVTKKALHHNVPPFLSKKK